jgi:hypothetical protein
MYIEVLEESDFYLKVRLQKIPYELWNECLDTLKSFKRSYDANMKAFTIKKSDLKKLENTLDHIINSDEPYEEPKEEPKKRKSKSKIESLSPIQLIDYLIKSEIELNKKLELSNTLIKHLRGISIELNKQIYKG